MSGLMSCLFVVTDQDDCNLIENHKTYFTSFDTEENKLTFSCGFFVPRLKLGVDSD